MARDKRVVFYGEDVADYGGAFKVTKGLARSLRPRPRLQHADQRGLHLRHRLRRGDERPAAGGGADVLRLRADVVRPDQQPGRQMALHERRADRGAAGHPRPRPAPARATAASIRRRSNPCSATSRASTWFIPATPADAKGMLKSAIRDNNPVMFVESQALYGMKGPVPEGEYLVPLGVADVKRAGRRHHLRRLGPAGPRLPQGGRTS